MIDLDQYKLIVEASPNMIWRSDISSGCDYFNKTWLDFTGRSMEQECGYGWSAGVHPDDLERCVKLYLDSFKKHQSFEMEYRLKRHDGQYRWINDCGIPFYDKEGMFIGFIGSCMDVNEKIESQQLILNIEKLRNADLTKSIEMKDEILALISHELKTPLAVINSAIQVIEIVYANELSDKVREYLHIIQQNTNRQLKLVNNILDNTKLMAGQFNVNKKNINIVELTKRIIEATIIYAQQKNIKLSFTSTVSEKVIGVDEAHYEKILLNLLSNAIKFTSNDKSITVKVFQKKVKGKDKICIQVKDEGIGIPNDKKDLIFEKFGQVDTTFSRPAEGTGIGLSIVKMLVKLLDGEITLDSKVGVGSKFTIILPATKVKKALEEKEITERPNDSYKKTIDIEFSDINLKRAYQIN